MGIYQGNADPLEPISILRDIGVENQYGMTVDISVHPSLLHELWMLLVGIIQEEDAAAAVMIGGHLLFFQLTRIYGVDRHGAD